MTGNPITRVAPRLLTIVVLVVSGTYLLVYLYRWEWNRALISGLFFLAAEVAFVGSSIRADIRRLSARTEALEAGAEQRLHARLGDAGARPARPFAWLRESARGTTNVFVPVLLGAGVILSALAFVVERVAGAVAHATVDRGTARRLAVLEPPAHGLLGTRTAPSPVPEPDTGATGRLAGPAGRAVAVALAALMVVAAVDVLADATQSRPAAAEPGTTVVELRVDQQRPRPAVDAAEALAVACRGTLRTDANITRVSSAGGDLARIEVTPALSELRRRRLFGCLEDATLDLVEAHVTGWHITSEPAPAAG